MEVQGQAAPKSLGDLLFLLLQRFNSFEGIVLLPESFLFIIIIKLGSLVKYISECCDGMIGISYLLFIKNLLLIQ